MLKINCSKLRVFFFRKNVVHFLSCDECVIAKNVNSYNSFCFCYLIGLFKKGTRPY